MRRHGTETTMMKGKAMRNVRRAAIVTIVVMLWARGPARDVAAVEPVDVGGHVDAGGTSGASHTMLPDGGWLWVGGDDRGTASGMIGREDPLTGTVLPLGQLHVARAGHTATMLPSGKVLVVGGVGADGEVVAAHELIDVANFTVDLMATPNVAPMPRALHTATVLLDGTVVFAGGIDARGAAIATIQRWDPRTNDVEDIGLPTARYGHSAILLADGEVLLWGGVDERGNALTTGDLYDPLSGQLFLVTEPPAGIVGVPMLEASIPADGAVDVETDTIIGVRFSAPVTGLSFILETGNRTVPVRAVPAEQGMEYFIRSRAGLRGGATYVLRVRGSVQQDVRFTTKGGRVDAGPASDATPTEDAEQVAPDESWIPDSARDWRTGRGASHWASLPPLKAPKGVTALAGQVLRITGEPITGVRLQIGDQHAQTDATGRFLLSRLSPGHAELSVDGGKAHGFYEIGVDVAAGVTTALAYTIWLTPIDWEHAITIPSPTDREVVVSSPLIPGLEVRIPPWTTLRDHEGNAITTVTLTAIPLDRPPFPLPGVDVPLYFTLQPGAAYVENWSGAGARVFYPNRAGHPRGRRFDFWHYDPDRSSGWYVYGRGQVAEDEQHVVPYPETSVYEFTGAMAPPAQGQPTGGNGSDGDPVDLATGSFVYDQTDLVLRDVIPIVFTRTLRSRDVWPGPFGLGGTHRYEIFLLREDNNWDVMQLVLPGGERVRFLRTSGSAYQGTWLAGFERNEFSGAQLQSPGPSNAEFWNITLRNGTTYTFPESFGATRTAQGALVRVRDRFGNQLQLIRDANSNLVRIVSPNGRFMELDYVNNRVTQLRDNAGRHVDYGYDADGRLQTVTDAKGGITTYSYDPSCHEISTIRDARNITYLTNTYGSDHVPGFPDLSVGCLVKQQISSGVQFNYDYSPNFYTAGSCGPSGCPIAMTPFFTNATVTYADGTKRKTVFDEFSGVLLSDTEALGTASERTTTYSKTATQYSVQDTRGRITRLGLDGRSNVTSVTYMAGTAEAKVITLTYEPQFFRLSSIAFPGRPAATLSWTGLYDVTLTDPTGIPTRYHYNGKGQLATVTDVLNDVVQLSYDGADLVRIDDARGGITQAFFDGAGRARRITNALGNVTDYTYDNFDAVTAVVDALNGRTDLEYDENGNVTRVRDPRGKETTYVYDANDRLQYRRDPLYVTNPGPNHQETFAYDVRGNVETYTNRRGQITRLKADRFNRWKCLRFGTTATADPCTTPSIQYTYDDVDRVTQIVTPSDGTVTRTYDNLNFLTSEAMSGTSPAGTITFTPNTSTYDRATMSVPGFSAVSYQFDNAARLSQITQGSNTVSITPDAVGRYGTVQHANGTRMVYGYDANWRITSIQYLKADATVLGGLAYDRDAMGNIVKTSGSWARTGLPAAIPSTVYDDANRLTSWNGNTLTYDDNGNLTSGLGVTFTWNAQDQLTRMVSAFGSTDLAYDALGRWRSSQVGSTVATFFWDGPNVASATTGGTSRLMLDAPGLDHHLEQVSSDATVSALFTDQLGSTVAVADATAALAAEYTYEPFGKTTNTGTSPTDFQFTGRQTVGGYYYYRARYYSPTYQRFLSEDPIEFAGGFNLYGYVNGSPCNHRDPLGLCPMGGVGLGDLPLFRFLPDLLPEGAGEGWTIGEPTEANWPGNSFFGPDGTEWHWVPGSRSHAGQFPDGYWHFKDWNVSSKYTRVGPGGKPGGGPGSGFPPLPPGAGNPSGRSSRGGFPPPGSWPGWPNC